MRILDKTTTRIIVRNGGRKIRPFKHYIILITFLLIGTFLYAQERAVSSGGEANGTGGSMSFSIGQIDYINVTSATAMITQGVQQPEEILISLGNKPIVIDRNPMYTLYPNPAIDHTVLYINQPITKDTSYVLYDLLGRVMASERLINVRTTIKMDRFPDAVYVLTLVEDNSNKVVRKFKIVKKR